MESFPDTKWLDNTPYQAETWRNEASFLSLLTLINDIDRGKIYKKCIYLQSLMAFPMLTYLRTMGAQSFSANNY